MDNQQPRQWQQVNKPHPGKQDWGLLVLPFKGWCVLEHYAPAAVFDEDCVVLLKPDAHPHHPQPGDIRVLVGVAAEAWRRQNGA
jgi:hypothetical protein